jgi:DNA replication licensing factor MCM4
MCSHDIHSSLPLTPSVSRRARRVNGDNLNDNTYLSLPPSSSAPLLSAPEAPSDEPDEIRAVWGTTVNLTETMKLFRDFLKGFKPKYCVVADRSRDLRTRTFASPNDAQVMPYELYMGARQGTRTSVSK